MMDNNRLERLLKDFDAWVDRVVRETCCVEPLNDYRAPTFAKHDEVIELSVWLHSRGMSIHSERLLTCYEAIKKQADYYASETAESDPSHTGLIWVYAEEEIEVSRQTVAGIIRGLIASATPETDNRLIDLTDTERNMVTALARDHMTAPELFKKAGYENTGYYRSMLSGLCKRGILLNDKSGYSLVPEHFHLLKPQ